MRNFILKINRALAAKKKIYLLFAAICCATMVNATEGALPGRFTINENGDQVQFAQGNLQYQPSTGKWRFAPNQYTVLLAKDEEFVKKYAEKPACRILAQTETVLAAESPAIGVAGYAFYKPETCNGITTDRGMIIITCETDGVVELRVSDVTQLLTEATITVEGVTGLLDASDTIKAAAADGKLTAHIDFTESFGRPYFIKFKKQ